MVVISKTPFKKFLKDFPTGKVLKKMESTERGQRLWPSQNAKNDTKHNFRCDKGSVLPDGRHELIFQANKNAEDTNVRKAAMADSHAIIAKVAVKPEEAEETVKAMALESFTDNN